MGNRIHRMIRPERIRVIILGLDAAGKTTILYQFKSGRSFDTIPTIGFNVEQIKIEGVEYTFWDVGGQDKLRLLWKHYYSQNSVLIFTVDSSCQERMLDAKDALSAVLMEPAMDSCIILVYANKQDMPDALTAKEIASRLELSSLMHRFWHVQPSCALTGEGLYEGLEWAKKSHRKASKIKNRMHVYGA